MEVVKIKLFTQLMDMNNEAPVTKLLWLLKIIETKTALFTSGIGVSSSIIAVFVSRHLEENYINK
jgi:hypothetical protein